MHLVADVDHRVTRQSADHGCCAVCRALEPLGNNFNQSLGDVLWAATLLASEKKVRRECCVARLTAAFDLRDAG